MIWQHLKASVPHLWRRLWAFCVRPGMASLALALWLLNLALGWLSVLLFAPAAVALEQALFVMAIAIGSVFALSLILVLALTRNLRWRSVQDTDMSRRLTIVGGLLLWAGLLSFAVFALAVYLLAQQVGVMAGLVALAVYGLYARLADKLAGTWQSLLTQKEYDFYTWHLHWRWQVLRMRWRRWRQAFSLWHWLAQLRALWVLLAAAVSLYLLLWIQHGALVWENPLLALHSLFFTEEATPESRTYTLLLGSLVSAPVLFLLWKFRDTNQLWQLENSRKDINLKDFQQLARWAAGEHLPEINVEYASPKDEQPALSATQGLLDLQADAHPPIHKLSHSLPPQRSAAQGSLPSWRAGAESLQVAAVYQLDAFLAGEYGRHFQRPAFQLLCQLWRSVNESVASEAVKDTNFQCGYLDEVDYETLVSEIQVLLNLVNAKAQLCKISLKSALGQALHAVLWAQAGQRLRAHAPELAGTYWAGLDSGHAVLSQYPPLELDGLPLAGSNWIGANLSYAKLQGADLRHANLQGVDLSYAELEGANLQNAELQGAFLRLARFDGANLRFAQMQGANLSLVQLKGADLGRADLHGVHLTEARLDGAKLSGAQLQQANLFGAGLRGADLSFAHLENSFLILCLLQGADLRNAQLHGADLSQASLEGADLRNIALDDKTQFAGCTIDAATQIGVWLNAQGKIATKPWEMDTAQQHEALSAALLQQMQAQGFPRLEPEVPTPQIQAGSPDE